MSKPYFAPFKVADFAPSLKYLRDELVLREQRAIVQAQKREHEHTLKLARDARYRANKKARRLADESKALYLRTPLATQAI